MVAERNSLLRPAMLGALPYTRVILDFLSALAGLADERRWAMVLVVLLRAEEAMAAYCADYLEPARRAYRTARGCRTRREGRREAMDEALAIDALAAALATFEPIKNRFDRLAGWYLRAVLCRLEAPARDSIAEEGWIAPEGEEGLGCA